MPEKDQCCTMRIGSTVFYVTSTFSGKVELQHIIKRLIRKEMEQAYG